MFLNPDKLRERFPSRYISWRYVKFSVSGSMLEIYYTLTSLQKQVIKVSLVLKDSDTESGILSVWSRFLHQIARKQTVQKMYHL